MQMHSKAYLYICDLVVLRPTEVFKIKSRYGWYT